MIKGKYADELGREYPNESYFREKKSLRFAAAVKQFYGDNLAGDELINRTKSFETKYGLMPLESFSGSFLQSRGVDASIKVRMGTDAEGGEIAV
jgi:hypothetical protein